MAQLSKSAAPVEATTHSGEEHTSLARPHKTFYQRNDAVILGGGAVVLVLVIWEFFWSIGQIDPLFFSGPSAVALRFADSFASGEMIAAIQASGVNFVLGLGLAALIGIPLGILIGWYRPFRLVSDPFLNGFYATPRIALVPLVVIWFGLGVGSKVFLVFLSAIFPIVINTMAGVRTADPQLLRAARSFCATDRELFLTVIVPSTVPFIIAGLRQGIAHALIGVVVGELFIGGVGVGSLIVDAGTEFETDTMFAGVIVIATTGIVLSILLQRIEQRFSRWRSDQ